MRPWVAGFKDVHTTIPGPNYMAKKLVPSQAVVAYTFNPSTQEAEAGGSLSLRPACSMAGSKATEKKKRN